jgi:hypothetical protein
MKKADKETIIYICNLMITHLSVYGEPGMCSALHNIYQNGDITILQYGLMSNYIRDNRPKRGIHYDTEYKDSVYWYFMWSTPPRIAWLTYTKTKLSK